MLVNVKVTIGRVPTASAIALEVYLACSKFDHALPELNGWILRSVGLGCIEFVLQPNGGSVEQLRSVQLWTDLLATIVPGVQVQKVVLQANVTDFVWRALPELEVIAGKAVSASEPVLALNQVALMCLNRLDLSTFDARLVSKLEEIEYVLCAHRLEPERDTQGAREARLQQALWDLIFFSSAIHTGQDTLERALCTASELLHQLQGSEPAQSPSVALFDGPDVEGSEQLEALPYLHLAYPSLQIWEQLHGIDLGLVCKLACKQVGAETKFLLVHADKNWVCETLLFGKNSVQRRPLSGGTRHHALATYYRLLASHDPSKLKEQIPD